MEDVTVILRTPIQEGDETITELTVREPRVADSLEADRQTTDAKEAELLLMAKLTGRYTKTLRQMGLYDYLKVQDAIYSFLDSPPENSGT